MEKYQIIDSSWSYRISKDAQGNYTEIAGKHFNKGDIVSGEQINIHTPKGEFPAIRIGHNHYLNTYQVVRPLPASVHHKFSGAEGSSPVLKYQILHDVNWIQLSSGQMVGHPINPYNPSSDYKQGDIITGREVSVSYIDNSGKDPKNKTEHFIAISSNKYIPRNSVSVYSGGKPTGNKQRFSGAEGSSPVLKYRTVNVVNRFGVSVGGAYDGGIMNEALWYKKGTIFSGREKTIKYKNNGWTKGAVIEVAPKMYIWKKDVVLYSGKPSHSNAEGSRVGYSKYQIIGNPADTFKYDKGGEIVKNNKVLVKGTIISGVAKSIDAVKGNTYSEKVKVIDMGNNLYVLSNLVKVYVEKPTSYSKAEGVTSIKNLNTGTFITGVTFGLLGTSIGVMLGVNTKTVIVLAGAGTVIGCLAGKGLSGDSFYGADGKSGNGKGVYKEKIRCIRYGLVFDYYGSKCPEGSSAW